MPPAATSRSARACRLITRSLAEIDEAMRRSAFASRDPKERLSWERQLERLRDLGDDGAVAASVPALVEPAVLRWARESIGLSVLAAERKLGLPEGRVEAWETCEATPTIAQLRSAASVYKRPLGVFFLPEPPTDFDAMRDFRRHVGASAGAWSSELHGEFRRAQAQRGVRAGACRARGVGHLGPRDVPWGRDHAGDAGPLALLRQPARHCRERQ